MREKTESSDYERLIFYSEYYTSSKLGKDDPIDSHKNSVWYYKISIFMWLLIRTSPDTELQS